MNLTVVLGSASCLYDDLRELRSLTDIEAATIVAVNDAVFRWPGNLHHVATLHPKELDYRIARRERYGYPGGFETWTCPFPVNMLARHEKCDYTLAGWGEGSSGWFAVGVARDGLGGRRIVGCGMPMDARPHLDRPHDWSGFERYRQAWLDGAAALGPYFRSMSGWTREVYGAPDAEWLPTSTLTGVND